MTPDKVVKVLTMYQAALGAHPVEEWGHGKHKCRLCHLSYMLAEMLGWFDDWDDDEWEKVGRWLGFIQGVLWCEGVYTIDEMREHNRE